MSKKLIILAFLVTTFTFGQEEEESIYQQELNKMVKIPNSPEAQAFAKYGDYNVSMYSGTPNIAVPLYAIKGREMDLPMSLTYDATGIKVEQLATWAGLGWNLNVGGRITRRTNGLPDDYMQGDYITFLEGRSNMLSKRDEIAARINSYLNNPGKIFPSPQAVRDYFTLLDTINKNFVDAQPDVFTISAPGLSTSVVFDINDNYQPKSLDNPRIKVDNVYRGTRGNREIIGWRITNEDGTTYYFGNTPFVENENDENAYETTLRNGSDLTPNGVIRNEYVSSWLLTRIVSSNGKDKYDFEYYDNGYWSQPILASSAINSSVTLRPFETFYSINEVAEQFADGAGYFISQQFLNRVYHNDHLRAQVSRGNRFDIDVNGTNTRLASIDIYDYDENQLREFTFLNDSYFNDDANNSTDWRLKLDGILIKDANLTTTEKYSFEYDRPNSIPSRLSRAQDFAGYYNGANSNPVLYERYEANNGDIVFEGANRDPNSDYAKIGLLNKITYPTGGSTEFEFEGNFAVETTSNQVHVTDVVASLHASSPDNTQFFLTDTGGFPAVGDQFAEDGFYPKITRARFRIDERPSPLTPYFYEVDFYGSAPNDKVEAYVFKIPDGQTYSNFSDLLAFGIYWQNLNKINDQSINLDPGNYVAVVLMDELEGTGNTAQGPQYGNIVFTINHQETVFSNQDIDQGGVRVASIKNYESAGNFANGKSYEYVEQNPRNIRPSLAEVKTIGEESVLIRRAFQTQADDRITYRTVREYQINQDGNSEGYVESRFFTGPNGFMPSLRYPYESNYFPSLKGGQLESQGTYNSNDEKVSAQKIEYFETYDRPININGLTAINDDEFLGDYIYIRDNLNGTYGYEHITAIECPQGQVISDSRGFAFGGGAFCQPLPCFTDFTDCAPYVELIDVPYGGLNLKETFINAAYGGVSVQRDTLFYKDVANNPLEHATSTITTYESNTGYYLPVETHTVDSKGDIYRQTLTYPSTGGSEYTSLLNKNNLVEVVASKNELVDANDNVEEFISARKNEYFSAGQVVLPSKIFTSKTSENDLEERMSFTYYGNGNLRQSQQTGGPPTSYVWGYDNMLPVAKVENATSSDVNGTYSPSVLNDLTSTDAAKRTELDNIRNGLPDALVTTFTYNPAIGVTSSTDSRGYTTHFNYDPFSRLMETRDADNNLLQEYEYSYRSDTYVNPDGQNFDAIGGTINGANTIDYGATSSYNASITGGSGDFTISWYQDNTLIGNNVTQLDVTFNTSPSSVLRVDIVDDITGDMQSITKTVAVESNIGNVTLTANPTLAYVNETFTINSSGINQSLGGLTYTWYLDGSNTPESFTGATGFQVAFSTTGTHYIRLVVTHGPSGSTAEDTVDVTVLNPLPSLSLTASETFVLTNTDVVFTPTDLDLSYGLIEIEWSIESSAGTEILSYQNDLPYTHSFATPGTYTVKFRVTALATNQSEEATATVTVSGGLSVGTLTASATNILVGQSVTFTKPSILGGSGDYDYEWVVQSNVESTLDGDFTYNGFTTQNDYYIKLRVIDNGLGQTRESNLVRIDVWNPISQLSITTNTNPIYTGQSVTFNATYDGGSGNNTLNWYRRYENGTEIALGSSTNLATSFNNPGTYTIRVVVVDNDIAGHQVESTRTYEVYDALNVGNISANTTKIIRGSSVTFTAPSIVGGSGNRSYQWLVNNVVRSTSSGNFTYNQFNTAGDYDVKFRATDNDLGISDESQTIVVNVYNPLNDPAFTQTVNHIEVGEDLYMNTTNIGGGSGSRNYKWYVKLNNGNFTQISGASNTNLTYNGFNSVGTYTIKFRVTDNNVPSHFKEVSRTVNVYAPIQISNSDITTPSPVQLNGTTFFNINTASGGSGSFEYEWDLINQSVTPNYFYGIGTFSEANRNVSNFPLDNYEYVGNNVKIQCRVWDLLTGKYVTVFKIIVVEGNDPISGLFVGSRDTDPDPETASYSLNAGGVTGGSGSYIYRWVVDGQVVQESSNNRYQFVELDCSRQSATVTCVAIDAVTDQSILRTITINLGFNCGGGQ